MQLGIDPKNGVVTVWLSERNLLTLLASLQEAEWRPTLTRQVESGLRLVVIPQADNEHYQGRRPGPMPQQIEQAIQSYQRRQRSGGSGDN